MSLEHNSTMLFWHHQT